MRDCTLENIASLASLCEAANQSARGIRWKSSVIRYHLDPMGNAQRSRSKLLNGEDVHTGFVRFCVHERGKLREIAAVKYPERVIQKSANQNALVPAITDTLIYDNSANVKGKGTYFAVKRMIEHMTRHYRKHGREGYILLGDFSEFFASIPHEGAKELVERHLDDAGAIALVSSQIDHQDGDRGLTLGSEINQTLAVAYPSRIDHFVVECCGVEAYGRYMDDFYAIHESKEHLQIVLGCIEAISWELGLTLNAKKTHIVKLTHGFTFLKRKFSYGENGEVVVRPVRTTISRERRRLKKHARLVAEGRMTYEQACESYQSWRGLLKQMDAHGAILRMDALFAELFGDRRSKITEDPPPATYLELRIMPFAKPLETRGVFFLPKPTERTERWTK